MIIAADRARHKVDRHGPRSETALSGGGRNPFLSRAADPPRGALLHLLDSGPFSTVPAPLARLLPQIVSTSHLVSPANLVYLREYEDRNVGGDEIGCEH